jgi:cytoskeletal protein RodZ
MPRLIKRKIPNKEKGFISRALLVCVIIILLLDAIVFENTMVNKAKELTPALIDSVSSVVEEKKEGTSKTSKETDSASAKKEEYSKEDIRYTKNCEEIVEEMGMGDRLIRENDKKMNIRYHQTNGNDLMITIGKDGSCTIKEDTNE